MKITFISDTHSRHHRIKLPGGDMLIFSGDFMTNGYYVDEIPKGANNPFINLYCRKS